MVLAEIFSQVGHITGARQCYSIICKPRGRKFRNLGQLFKLIKRGTTSQLQTPTKSLQVAIEGRKIH